MKTYTIKVSIRPIAICWFLSFKYNDGRHDNNEYCNSYAGVKYWLELCFKLSMNFQQLWSHIINDEQWAASQVYCVCAYDISG